MSLPHIVHQAQHSRFRALSDTSLRSIRNDMCTRLARRYDRYDMRARHARRYVSLLFLSILSANFLTLIRNDVSGKSSIAVAAIRSGYA